MSKRETTGGELPAESVDLEQSKIEDVRTLENAIDVVLAQWAEYDAEASKCCPDDLPWPEGPEVAIRAL